MIYYFSIQSLFLQLHILFFKKMCVWYACACSLHGCVWVFLCVWGVSVNMYTEGQGQYQVSSAIALPYILRQCLPLSPEFIILHCLPGFFRESWSASYTLGLQMGWHACTAFTGFWGYTFLSSGLWGIFPMEPSPQFCTSCFVLLPIIIKMAKNRASPFWHSYKGYSTFMSLGQYWRLPAYFHGNSWVPDLLFFSFGVSALVGNKYSTCPHLTLSVYTG